MIKIFITLILFFSFNFSAVACDWAPKEQKVSEFVSGKTIFWGRAVEAKWDKTVENDELGSVPRVYNIVEVIKPIEGNVGRKVKVWADPSSCGTYIPLGIVQLIVVRPYQKNSFYTDQLISHGASEASIIAYLNEGIDISAKGSFYAPHITEEEMETKCQNTNASELPNFCVSKHILNEIYKVYKKENEIVKELTNKKPWWHFKKKL